MWRDCSRQQCLLKTGPKQFCALVPFKDADEVIDMSINVLPRKVFVVCNEVIIHTSLCAVSPPGCTDDAGDWGLFPVVQSEGYYLCGPLQTDKTHSAHALN